MRLRKPAVKLPLLRPDEALGLRLSPEVVKCLQKSMLLINNSATPYLKLPEIERPKVALVCQCHRTPKAGGATCQSIFSKTYDDACLATERSAPGHSRAGTAPPALKPRHQLLVVVSEQVAVDRVQHSAVFPAQTPHYAELVPARVDQPGHVRVAQVMERERRQSCLLHRGVPVTRSEVAIRQQPPALVREDEHRVRMRRHLLREYGDELSRQRDTAPTRLRLPREDPSSRPAEGFSATPFTRTFTFWFSRARV